MPPKKGKLNTWDVPELLPGARCSANATQRDYFERRCDKVFQADRKEAAEHAEQRQWDLDCETTLAVEADVETLTAMFPQVDLTLLREIYLEAATMEEACAQLLILAGPPEPEPEEAEPLPLRDAASFPALGGAVDLPAEVPLPKDSPWRRPAPDKEVVPELEEPSGQDEEAR